MYAPFAPMGLGAIPSTASFVFISFAGTTKFAAIGGEVENPQRNLPLGLFLSWAIGTVLYVSVIFGLPFTRHAQTLIMV
jgi:amino acid transporter